MSDRDNDITERGPGGVCEQPSHPLTADRPEGAAPACVDHAERRRKGLAHLLLVMVAGGLCLCCLLPFGLLVLVVVTGRVDVDRASDRISLGMTQEQVRDLLGLPNREVSRSNPVEIEWTYYDSAVHACSGLHITFDAEGRVREKDVVCY